MEVNPKHIPKEIKQKIALINVLIGMRDIEALRVLRDDKSSIVKVGLYHHSEGTASYYHDAEKRYYTEAEILKAADNSLKKGEWLITVVIPYKANIMFTSGSANAAKYN